MPLLWARGSTKLEAPIGKGMWITYLYPQVDHSSGRGQWAGRGEARISRCETVQRDVSVNVGGHLKGQLGRGNDRSGKYGWLFHGVIQ